MTNDEFLDSFKGMADSERLDQAEKAALEIGEVLDAAEAEAISANVRSVDFLSGLVCGLVSVTEGRRTSA